MRSVQKTVEPTPTPKSEIITVPQTLEEEDDLEFDDTLLTVIMKIIK